ncbi:Crp/Fnr family transcriptional regulator [Pareuzebyella sediminis]|uniref:Crp/Fnr family transcriptional regulator n=1 Tax=Pareuzebyella sediminis TaxID=2607998 RepID=UPI0011EBF64E|nr:Crp/Fnr family transcriptional regulator [Pareuzebyella sediminis]
MKNNGPLLHYISKYIQLTQDEKEEFESILIRTCVQRKSYLVQPGDMVNHIYFVLSGCLKAYYQDEMGNMHILQFAVEDWWITDFDAMHHKAPAALYIRAIEDSSLVGIDMRSLELLFARIPKFERFFRILYTKAFIALRKRVMSSLQKSCADRYLEFCEKYPGIQKRVTNYHIANYLGVTAESLSRIRRVLN